MPLVLPQISSNILMPSTTSLVATAVVGLIALPLLKVVRIIVHVYLSPAKRIIDGPKGGSFFLGHISIIAKAEKVEWHQEMLRLYGHVFAFRSFMGAEGIITTDSKALNHITNNTHTYQKPAPIRKVLTNLFGYGVLAAEGVDHKKQRRIMNPAFSNSHIREMTSIFVAKSQELRDQLLTKLPSPGADADADSAEINLVTYMNQATLDIIGLAGFDYSFDSLSGHEGELSKSFDAILGSDGPMIVQIISVTIPVLRPFLHLSQRMRTVQASSKKIMEIGRQIVEGKKEEIRKEKASDGRIEDGKAGDLLSLLIRSNMGEHGAGMTDEEVMNQIPTFLVAGHETTSTATSWALFSLAINPDAQTRLRNEISELETDTPTMEDLNSLKYLDAVVRESMRLHSILNGVDRVAVEDDIIPLEKPFKGKDGRMHASIPVTKGDSFFLPIAVLNNSEEIWGPDADQFNPDRWLGEGPPKASLTIPSVWGNQFSFLAGSRSCIGYKFAVVEMKALIYNLVRTFEFELAVDPARIGRKSLGVARSFVKDESGKGSQMPMRIRLAASRA